MVLGKLIGRIYSLVPKQEPHYSLIACVKYSDNSRGLLAAVAIAFISWGLHELSAERCCSHLLVLYYLRGISYLSRVLSICGWSPEDSLKGQR